MNKDAHNDDDDRIPPRHSWWDVFSTSSFDYANDRTRLQVRGFAAVLLSIAVLLYILQAVHLLN